MASLTDVRARNNGSGSSGTAISMMDVSDLEGGGFSPTKTRRYARAAPQGGGLSKVRLGSCPRFQ